MKEEWKIYKETNNRRHGHIIWEISNYGNVKKNGEKFILKKNKRKNGKDFYYTFGTCYFVHRAVAECFIPNPYNKPCVDHIDTNMYNNMVTNLRWVTHHENSMNELSRINMSKSKIGKSNGPFSEQARYNMSIAHKKLFENKNIN